MNNKSCLQIFDRFSVDGLFDSGLSSKHNLGIGEKILDVGRGLEARNVGHDDRDVVDHGREVLADQGRGVRGSGLLRRLDWRKRN